jgi:RNA polymerase sigma-70 factor, ECF subfamily
MTASGTRDALDAVYRREGRRVLATLIRLLGGFDAAEEALQDAFAAAADQWPRDGVPANPTAWLVSAGRFKTIDRWRKQARLTGLAPDLTLLAQDGEDVTMPEAIADDELRLIFTCCHPALAPDARIALTLREVGGLTTEEIARAYLTRTPTIAQRIVRAKAKIRDDSLPYEVPDVDQLSGRLASVLRVIYLIFNEGYTTTAAPSLTRTDLFVEAIRMGRLLVRLLDASEAKGLLALMLLHDARRTTRTDTEGDIILLEDQDRALWDRAVIAEAQKLIAHAFALKTAGPYTLQASIAAIHAEAASFRVTDWGKIVTLYDALLRTDPSPVAALNRAVAVGMRDGPKAGLIAIENVVGLGGLDEYHLAHAARADIQRRLGQIEAARASYRRALDFAHQPAERRFLERRLDQIGGSA